uniref:NADH dehydrogenase subunit 4 n=1 Tax=Taeniothrips eucharii TaxID=1818613 RepID=UPI0030DEE02D
MLSLYFFIHFFESTLGMSWYNFILIMFFFYPFFFLYHFSVTFISKSWMFSLDSYSLLLSVLSFWIVLLSVLAGKIYLKSIFFSFYLMSFSFLLFVLIFFFLCNNMFMFFFFFESSLFPTFYIIVGWGNNFYRLQSGLYLFFYTLFSSIPFLVSMFMLFFLNFSLNFFFLNYFFFNKIYYLFLIVSFLVKMPMFLFHSWLPKAHVEAPVSGSMLLAGVLLKMGGYGLYRFFFYYKFFLDLNLIWIYISIWGGLLSGLICFRQVDMKSLIAFSSVSHMSLVVMGLLVFSDVSIFGSFSLMVSHGLCSSGLFFLSNMIYERSGSRNLFLNKGLISLFPSLSMWWFIFCSFNMACPPTLNLISEIFLINSLVSWSFIFVFFLMFMSFFSGVYNLYLFTVTNHGKIFSSIYSFPMSCKFNEYLIIYLHFFPTFFFFLKLEFFF